MTIPSELLWRWSSLLCAAGTSGSLPVLQLEQNWLCIFDNLHHRGAYIYLFITWFLVYYAPSCGLLKVSISLFFHPGASVIELVDCFSLSVTCHFALWCSFTSFACLSAPHDDRCSCSPGRCRVCKFVTIFGAWESSDWLLEPVARLTTLFFLLFLI